MKKRHSFAAEYRRIVRSLEGTAFVVASESPRRYALLRDAGFSFSISPSGAAELINASVLPEENARLNALGKAKAVSARMPRALVLGADTLVFHDGEYFGKPANRAEAERILSRLSGTTHTVLTGVALLEKEAGIELSACDATRVTMRKVAPAAIRRYVASGKGLSKAGAFAIQDIGDEFIEGIEGSYTNVVGLPMERLKELFERYMELKDERKA
jgi:septum formation protein